MGHIAKKMNLHQGDGNIPLTIEASFTDTGRDERLQFTEHCLLSVFTELYRTIILDSAAESFGAKLTDLFPI